MLKIEKVRTSDGKLREGVKCPNGKWRVKICGVNVYLKEEDMWKTNNT